MHSNQSIFKTLHLFERHHRRNLLGLEGLGFASRKGGDNRPCVRTHWYLCVSVIQAVVKRQSCDPWDATNHTIKYSPMHHFHIQERILFGWQDFFRTADIDLINVLQFSGWSDYIRKSELISFNRVICVRVIVVFLHCMQIATVYSYCRGLSFSKQTSNFTIIYSLKYCYLNKYKLWKILLSKYKI